MVILAMTADGKIADRKRSPARFGSAADKAHLDAPNYLSFNSGWSHRTHPSTRSWLGSSKREKSSTIQFTWILPL